MNREQITTVAELEALPERTFLQDHPDSLGLSLVMLWLGGCLLYEDGTVANEAGVLAAGPLTVLVTP
jgi:uncharacterized protein YfaT (DUF1175 family)